MRFIAFEIVDFDGSSRQVTRFCATHARKALRFRFVGERLKNLLKFAITKLCFSLSFVPGFRAIMTDEQYLKQLVVELSKICGDTLMRPVDNR